MWNTIIIQPLSNVLLLFVGWFDGSVFWAVVAMTIAVKVILFPLAYKAFISQREQQFLAPKIRELKKQFTDKKEQNAELVKLYKDHKTNPFSGCLVLLIQLPVLIGIYHVFLSDFAHLSTLAYAGITVPENIVATIFGISLSTPSIIIGILAGVTQLIQVLLSPVFKKAEIPTGEALSFEDKMTGSMQGSMKWSMPIMMAVIGAIIPAAVSVYLVVSNIFTIGQEQIFMWMEKRAKARKLSLLPEVK